MDRSKQRGSALFKWLVKRRAIRVLQEHLGFAEWQIMDSILDLFLQPGENEYDAAIYYVIGHLRSIEFRDVDSEHFLRAQLEAARQLSDRGTVSSAHFLELLEGAEAARDEMLTHKLEDFEAWFAEFKVVSGRVNPVLKSGDDGSSLFDFMKQGAFWELYSGGLSPEAAANSFAPAFDLPKLA